MPPRPIAQCATTRDTIAALWASASTSGEVTLRLPSRHQCYLFRNKLYAHRSAMRRQARAHTGFNTSAYDDFKILFREELDFDLNLTGHWLLTITRNDYVQFELLTDRESARSAIRPNTPTEQEQASYGEEIQESRDEVEESFTIESADDF